LDDLQLQAVLNRRDGGDEILGTEDDQPFQNLGEFFSLLGTLSQDIQSRLQQSLTVQSEFFTVRATGEVGNVKRTVEAVLHRNGAVISSVSWRELPGTSG
jgi:type II secretory pathway component PulK